MTKTQIPADTRALEVARLTRRMFMGLAVPVGLSLATSQIVGAAPAEKGSSLSASFQEPVAGGTLTVGVQVEPAILDAQLVGNTQEIPVASLLYDSLLKYTPTLELVPHLAESYEVVDPMTYRFKIRSDVSFHNGRTVTVEDVQFSLLRAKDPDLQITRRLVEMIDTVEIEDEQTILVTLSRPTPLFLHWVSSIQTAVVPKEEIEARGVDFGRNPVGTGPYKVDSWEAGSRITLSAYDNYFLDRPYIDQVIYRVLPDLTVVLLELESGTLDLAPFVSAQDFDRIQNSSTLQYDTEPQLNYWFFGMNSAESTEVAERIGIFRDKRVRQAVYHGVDWETVALFGLENDAFGYRDKVFYPTVVPWHDPSVEEAWPQPQYDPDLARQLLAEAGYGDGLDVEVLIWNPEAERVAIPLQEELANIGINMTIQYYELATWLEFMNPGNFDCCIARWTGQDSADPYAWMYLQFHSSSFGSAGNRARFYTAETDALLDAAESEPDPALRLTKYIDAAKALAGEFAQIPLFGTNAVSVWNPNVHGFEADALSSWSASVVRLWFPPYAQVWLDPQ